MPDPDATPSDPDPQEFEEQLRGLDAQLEESPDRELMMDTALDVMQDLIGTTQQTHDLAAVAQPFLPEYLRRVGDVIHVEFAPEFRTWLYLTTRMQLGFAEISNVLPRLVEGFLEDGTAEVLASSASGPQLTSALRVAVQTLLNDTIDLETARSWVYAFKYLADPEASVVRQLTVYHASGQSLRPSEEGAPAYDELRRRLQALLEEQ